MLTLEFRDVGRRVSGESCSAQLLRIQIEKTADNLIGIDGVEIRFR